MDRRFYDGRVCRSHERPFPCPDCGSVCTFRPPSDDEIAAWEAKYPQLAAMPFPSAGGCPKCSADTEKMPDEKWAGCPGCGRVWAIWDDGWWGTLHRYSRRRGMLVLIWSDEQVPVDTMQGPRNAWHRANNDAVDRILTSRALASSPRTPAV